MDKTKVYINHSEKDNEYYSSLIDHLSPINEKVRVSSYESVLPGKNFKQEILKEIQSTQVILHLLSKNFLANETCKELRQLSYLDATKENIYILLTACFYEPLEIKELILPRNKTPLYSQSDIELAFTNIVIDINKSIERIQETKILYQELPFNEIIEDSLQKLSFLENKFEKDKLVEKLLDTLENISDIILIGNHKAAAESFDQWQINKVVLNQYMVIINKIDSIKNAKYINNKVFKFIQKNRNNNILNTYNYQRRNNNKENEVSTEEVNTFISSMVISLESLQNILESGEAVIQFILLEDYVMFYFVNNSVVNFIRIKKPKDLAHNIALLNRFIENNDQDENEIMLYTRKLSKYLIHPIKDFILDQKRLYFIPDEELNSIPFEILPIKIDEESDELLLNERFKISYHYSIGLIHNWLTTR